MKNLKLIKFFVFAALSTQLTAKADMRYDTYCVTSPSDSETVLVYDDLQHARAQLYEESVAGNLVKSVKVYALTDVFVPAVPNNLEETLTSLRYGYPEALTGFQNFLHINKDAMIEKIYARGTYSVSSVQTANGADISVKNGVLTLFAIPYVELNSDGKMPLKQVRAAGLIFNGRSVSELTYYPCGQSAD